MGTKNNFTKNKGFSMIESLLALTLLGSGFLMYYSNNNKIEIQKNATDYNKETINFANNWAYNLTLKNSAFSKTKNGGPNGAEYTNYDFMQDNLLTSLKNGTPYLIQKADPNRNFTKLQQTPCVLVYYNQTNSGNNEINAILYYVQAKNKQYMNQYDIAFNASRKTPHLTGLYSDSKKGTSLFDKNGFLDSAGWKPNDNLLSIMKSNSCVPNMELSNNSIFVNIQMLPLFNDKQLAVSGIKKTIDQSVAFTDTNNQIDSQYLPGHLFNNNTLKSSLNVDNNIIFAKKTNDNAQVLLSQQTDTSNNNMLELGNGTGNNNNTAYVASSLQSNISMKAGSPCTSQEVGKILTQSKEVLNKEEQSRNIVVCTKNDTSCDKVGGYCYLQLKERKYKFNAPEGSGLEDVNGYFRCPSYAPYLSGFDIQNEKSNTAIFMNTPIGGSGTLYTTPDSQLTVSGINYVYSHDKSCGQWIETGICKWYHNDDYRNVFGGIAVIGSLSNSNPFYISRFNLVKDNNYPLGGNKNSYAYGSCTSQSLLCRDRDAGPSSAITSPILTSLNFSNSVMGKGISVSNSSFIPDYGSNPNAVTPIGIKRNTGTNSCSYLCDSLNNTTQYNINDSARWQELTSSSFYVAGATISKPANTCACARFGGGSVQDPRNNGQILNDPYIYGLAYVDYQQANHLSTATCSTIGNYVIK